MQQITIATLPNQDFSVTVDGFAYDITIKEANGIMAATVTINNTVVIENTRILPFQPIIPYAYLEEGNFAFTTQDNELPYYTAFGVTQFLYYITLAELAQLRAGA